MPLSELIVDSCRGYDSQKLIVMIVGRKLPINLEQE